MMTLTFRLVLVIGVLCGALLAAAIGVGAVASPHESLLTRNTCALPCLFGVTPGVSSRDQAIPLFERWGVSYSYYNPVGRTYPVHTSATPISLMMYMTFGDPFIGDVRWLQLLELSAKRSLGSLGDFVLAGYQPARVYSACQDNRRAIITFRDGRTFLQVPLDAGLLPNAPILQISTASDAEAQARSISAFVCADQSAWQGFAALWKYQNAF